MGKLLDLQQIKAEIMIRREIDYAFYKNAPKKTKILSEVITNQPKFRCMRGNYKCFFTKIRRVLSLK